MESFGIRDEVLHGFAFADAYEHARPSYPADAVEKLLAALHVVGSNSATIVDIGAGTGKFTEILSARPEQFNVIAIEPHNDMRLQLQRKNLRGVTIVDTVVEDMFAIADGIADAVIAAQAFHWFANGRALAEVHRILKPTRGFGMIWNIENYNAPESWVVAGWEERIRYLTRSLGDEKRIAETDRWREAFEKHLGDKVIAQQQLFEVPIHEDNIAFRIHMSQDALWSRYKTISHIASLGNEEQEQVEEQLFRELQDDKSSRLSNGEIVVRGKVVYAWTFKR